MKKEAWQFTYMGYPCQLVSGGSLHQRTIIRLADGRLVEAWSAYLKRKQRKGK